MSNKYKAPWFILDQLEGSNVGYRAILDNDGFTVCNPSPMGEANSHLIAAAPDMYEALQCQNAGNLLDQEGHSIESRDNALKVLENYGFQLFGSITYQEFVQSKTQAALTKAEGVAQ